MIDFLKNQELSDEAIEIYISCLGKSPLTHKELYSIIPDISPEKLKLIVEELIEQRLLVEIMPQKPEILLHYLAIPPFTPILNYHSNIHVDLINIQDKINKLMVDSLNKIVSENENSELESIYSYLQDFKKDLTEETLIQKNDLEEVIGDLDTFNEIKTSLADLTEILKLTPQKISSVTQAHFTTLVKSLPKIKSELIEKVKLLELKKKEPLIINLIEDFNSYIKNTLQDFSSEINDLIGSELMKIDDFIQESVINSIEKTVNDAFHFGNDFKLLYLNVISNSETKLAEILRTINSNKKASSNKFEKIKDSIIEKFDTIIQNSIKDISELSKPIEKILHQFEENKFFAEKTVINNLWLVKSKSKIIEEINSLVNNSKKDLTIVIPKIDFYLNGIQLENLPKKLRIRIASSDPHTNSVIKNIKELGNLEFRNIKNGNIIALKSDNNRMIICITQDTSKDPLDNSVGIGTNYPPLIELFSPIIEKSWATAKSDAATIVKPPSPPPANLKRPKGSKKAPEHIEREIEQHLEKNVKQKSVQEKETFESELFPKQGDEAGMQINIAFNSLILKLDSITAEDFSNELQEIAELILEKRGFSVTLHKIRSLINQYKDKNIPIDKSQVFEEIEDFKKRLF